MVGCYEGWPFQLDHRGFTFVIKLKTYICEQTGQLLCSSQVTNGTGRAKGVGDVLLNLYIILIVVGSDVYNKFLKHWFKKTGHFKG